MPLRTVQIAVTTTGSAGSASGNASSLPVNGEVRALHVDYHASAPAGTTDVTITCPSDDDHPEVAIYSKANSSTDAWVYPTVASTDTAGTGRTWYQHVVVQGPIKVAVAESNALTDCVVVTAYVWE